MNYQKNNNGGMPVAVAAARLEQRGFKAIWQDRVTGEVFFCDFEDLPPLLFADGYNELSEKELLEQEEKRVHF